MYVHIYPYKNGLRSRGERARSPAAKFYLQRRPATSTGTQYLVTTIDITIDRTYRRNQRYGSVVTVTKQLRS